MTPPQSHWLNQDVLAILNERAVAGGYNELIDWSLPFAVPQSSIKIRHKTTPFQFLDKLISRFAFEQATRLRIEGKLNEGPRALRLSKILETAGLLELEVQPCDYALQAGSSFVMDFIDPLFERWGGTLRTYLASNYQTDEIIDALPGCFGICGMIVTSDRKISVPLRGKKLASMATTWGPSVAGGIDFDDSIQSLDEIFDQQLKLELHEEVGLKEEEFRFRPTSFALEAARGMRPQLFALIETILDSSALLNRLNSLSELQREHDDLRWIHLDDPIQLSLQAFTELNYEASYALLVASRLPLTRQ